MTECNSKNKRVVHRLAVNDFVLLGGLCERTHRGGTATRGRVHDMTPVLQTPFDLAFRSKPQGSSERVQARESPYGFGRVLRQSAPGHAAHRTLAMTIC